MKGSSDAERLLVSLASHSAFDPDALAALLKATRLFGLTCGAQLAQYRNSGEPLQIAFADLRVLAMEARHFQAVAQLLAKRWQKVPERRRPHYTPHQRFQILELKSLMALSQKETAQLFAISKNTVARWEQEVATNPGEDTVGSLVKPNPPVRRFADVVRHLVHTMRLAGFSGCETIAQTLARVGWKISKRTVGRMLKKSRPSPHSQRQRAAHVSGLAIPTTSGWLTSPLSQVSFDSSPSSLSLSSMSSRACHS